MSEKWKSLASLKDAYNDASNYQAKDNKEFFRKIFLRTDQLDRAKDQNIYFIIGEKGSGKTAYATYIENNPPEKHAAKVVTLTETQYKRFIELKKQGRLAYSDFANIWRQILLVVTCQVIVEKSNGIISRILGTFEGVQNQLAKWNQKSLNPEVEVAFEAVLKDGLSGGINGGDIISFSAETTEQKTVKVTETSHRLLESELALKKAIQGLRLRKSHVIFIDGVDFRPSSISYSDYLSCIRGLGEAVWQLNQEFFCRIKDSPGRLRIVLLVRPDVFHLLNLSNSNSRIHDNSIFLDWSTTESLAGASALFELAGRYFSSQQDFSSNHESAWNNYFGDIGAFKKLLRTSFQKPRDILTFIKILRGLHVRRGVGDKSSFDFSMIADGEFTRLASDYLLGEVRDYASFYMSGHDFSAYIKFFQYLDGRSTFTMDEFEVAFDRFSVWVKGESVNKSFIADSETLLQFFYDVNIIGYREPAADSSTTFVHWSFRERSLNNFSPKVKSSCQLVINPGIAKALEIGKELVSSSRSERVRLQRVKKRSQGKRRKRPVLS